MLFLLLLLLSSIHNDGDVVAFVATPLSSVMVASTCVSSRSSRRMIMTSQTTVSLHPYFKPHDGKLAEFIAKMPAFVERTRSKEGVLFYDFTVCGDIIFCRDLCGCWRGAAPSRQRSVSQNSFDSKSTGPPLSSIKCARRWKICLFSGSFWRRVC